MDERIKEIKDNHEFRKGEDWELTILTEDIDLLIQTIEQQQEEISMGRVYYEELIEARQEIERLKERLNQKGEII